MDDSVSSILFYLFDNELKDGHLSLEYTQCITDHKTSNIEHKPYT